MLHVGISQGQRDSGQCLEVLAELGAQPGKVSESSLAEGAGCGSVLGMVAETKQGHVLLPCVFNYCLCLSHFVLAWGLAATSGPSLASLLQPLRVALPLQLWRQGLLCKPTFFSLGNGPLCPVAVEVVATSRKADWKHLMVLTSLAC